MTTQRFLRKIYNYKGTGRHLSVLFPPELAGELSEFVYIERTEDGNLLIRPTLIIPK